MVLGVFDPPSGVYVSLAIAVAASVGVLYAIACQIRNQTSFDDLKVKVEAMRADYERRREAAKARAEIFAEPVEEGATG